MKAKIAAVVTPDYVDQKLQARRMAQPQLAGKLAAQEPGGTAQSGQLLIRVAAAAKGQKPNARAT